MSRGGPRRGWAVAAAEARGVHGAASGRVGGEEGCVVGVVEEEEGNRGGRKICPRLPPLVLFLLQLALGALGSISMSGVWFDSGYMFLRLSWWLLERPLASDSHLLGAGCY